MSPTARTLEWLKKTGVTAGVVERWVTIPGHPGGGIRKDLFGCIDLIALRHGRTIGIQCTSGSNHAAHLTKVRCNAELREWLSCKSNDYELWSWTKKGKGQQKWIPRIDKLVVKMFVSPSGQFPGIASGLFEESFGEAPMPNEPIEQFGDGDPVEYGDS